MPDIVIKNGTVIDGTGAPGFQADVAIAGDRIEEIGRLGDAKNCKVIDATGKIVCPGIVDPHSHADMTIYRADHKKILAPLVKQGITTFIGGNCGMSMAPIGDNHLKEIKDYLEAFTGKDFESEVEWKTTAEFMNRIEGNGMLLNAALLAPHGLLRLDAMGFDMRYAADDEIKHMQRALEECMEAGCVGLSTGLQYMPGLQSDTRELVELGKVVAKHGGIFTSHLRSYMKTLPQAVDEVVEVARANGIRAQISHIFWVPDAGRLGRPLRAMLRGLIWLSNYWTPPIPLDGEVGKQLKKLDALREQEINIDMDVMPTTTGFTHLFAFFPPWVMVGGKDKVLERISNKETRKEILRDILHGKMVWPHTGRNAWTLNLFKLMGWECVRIMSVVSEKNKPLEGMNLPVIARERGRHPFDTVCDLLLEEEGRVLVFESMGRPEDNFTERSSFGALKHPHVSISTDTVLLGFGHPSYLFFGCYPKFIRRYVIEKKMLTMEQAVRKMTGLAAEHFKLKDRGLLKKGWFADVLVFDPEKIAPNVTFVEPAGEPSGIEHVFINGAHALENGAIRFDTAGRLLKN